MKGEIIPNNCTAHIWALAMIVMLRGFYSTLFLFFVSSVVLCTISLNPNLNNIGFRGHKR